MTVTSVAVFFEDVVCMPFSLVLPLPNKRFQNPIKYLLDKILQKIGYFKDCYKK
ncbi:hypothetical protein RV01_GL002381 [Enterococcus dispar]|nr:hypothetical protein RV01_GL002381 [Enterococcus dispar]